MKKSGSDKAIVGAEFFDALELLNRERGIPVDYLLEKITAALHSAYHKEFDGHDNVEIEIDPEARSLKMYQVREIVTEVEDPIEQVSYDALKAAHPRKKFTVGDTYREEVSPKDFRRLSAGAGKSVIVQGIREAEREAEAEAYRNRREEIIDAEVLAIEPNGDAIVETNYSRKILHREDQIPDEVLEVGSIIKVYIQEINKGTRGKEITLSRRHTGFVRRMFEQQIPEIADGTVLVRSITREPGSRTKIAVESRDPEIDAMGACVGNHGLRIAAITKEMAGEKVDVINYDEVPERYIANALAPATIDRVELISEQDRFYRAWVHPDQLSLAIGREGQNVRLAAKLTGFKIDIKSSFSSSDEY
ncbi:MAG: transcription termination/antitermination protein NusA [Clostridia bacterium]|nr:transcription termination/antitermination protein NusA [Clostridia bacterium]